ncbi:hypothetical protein [Streptomyces maremycinicus]|uniref:hypothetical protein n=1 Tax=Streptomyces maremycinicus TaxID=1679753 RepID=UPI000786FAC1
MTMAGIGAALLMIVCCAGTVLLAGGALAGLGGVLVSPWLLAPAAVLLVGGLLWRLRHRRTGSGDACCPPGDRPDQPSKRIQ